MLRSALAVVLLFSACAFGPKKRWTSTEVLAEHQAKSKQDAADRQRAIHCMNPWLSGQHSLSNATTARLKAEARGQRVSDEHEALFDAFAGYVNVDLPRLELDGCPIEKREEIESTWSWLRSAEEERKAELAKARRERDEAIAIATAAAEKMDATAKDHGYRAVWHQGGLTALLEGVVRENVEISKLAKVAVLIGGDDHAFVAQQVLPDRVLFIHEMTGAAIMLLRAKAYEGTRLDAVKCDALVVTGVVTYPTAIGATAQAFVVKPAW